jgi:hypothetical protein
MRQLRLIFLLSIALLSSGYRWRCYIFCTEQTGIQNDYVEIRDDCRDYADNNIDSAMTETKDPESKKLRKAKLVELFSNCMAKHGWDVPTTTVAKADDIPLYESSVSKVAASPEKTPVPTPVIIDNNNSDNRQNDGRQDNQTQPPADNSTQQENQQEIRPESVEGQEQPGKNSPSESGSRDERQPAPIPANTTSKSQSQTREKAETNNTRSQKMQAEGQSASQPENVRRQPAVTARRQTREAEKNANNEKQYSENTVTKKGPARAANSYSSDKAEESRAEAIPQQKAESKAEPVTTARNQTIYNETRYNSAEEAQPVESYERKPLPHNPGQTGNIKQQPTVTAKNTEASPDATPAARQQQAKLAAKQPDPEPASQEQVEQAAIEKTGTVTQNPSAGSQSAHSSPKPQAGSGERQIAENTQPQPQVTARQQTKNTQAAPITTASRKGTAQPDPTELSNMEPAAGTPAPTANAKDNIPDSGNIDKNKNAGPLADNSSQPQAQSETQLPWKNQNAGGENASAPPVAAKVQEKKAQSNTSPANIEHKHKNSKTADNAKATAPQARHVAKNTPPDTSSEQLGNSRKQAVVTGKPPARHIAKAAESPAKAEEARQQIKHPADKEDAQDKQAARNTEQITEADDAQQVFDSSLTNRTPAVGKNVKNSARSAPSSREDGAAKQPVAATVAPQAKRNATATETEISETGPISATPAKLQVMRSTHEPTSVVSQNAQDGNAEKTYITEKPSAKRATAAPVIDADAQDLPPAATTKTVAKTSQTVTRDTKVIDAPENKAAPSANVQQAFDASAAGATTTHLTKNPATGQAQASAMPSQPAVTAKSPDSANTQMAALLPPGAAQNPAANPDAIKGVKDNALAKRISECTLARSSAKNSSNAAAKAKLCDMECAELLKKSPNSPRPGICPPKEAAIDLLDGQLAGK